LSDSRSLMKKIKFSIGARPSGRAPMLGP